MGERLFELRRRTFDTPHFRGITFIETEAKSIINHVPGNSLPFEWTINPYRGCSHACSYCASGETPILMADGRTKPLAEVSVGDAIYGTERRGGYRRYVSTEVLAHWQTIKPAYRVVLDDGTELIASADHRFLSDRGWKHVTGTEQGQLQRSHLTTNNRLIGVGHFAVSPKHDVDYRRGYLTGMLRGDGHVGSYSYQRPGRTRGDVHRFRVALKDVEGLHRTQDFLSQEGVTASEFPFSEAISTACGVRAIRTSARRHIDRIGNLIRWPAYPSEGWRKGFLAGIFDAEGSFSTGILRICNCDSTIIQGIVSGLDSFGFSYRLETRRRTNKPLIVVRLLGGLKEKLRFFHTVDPAITRKRTIEGIALKSDAKLRVMAIEPTGFEIPMFDITTGTGDFIADGVVSHNCFARSTHTYMDMNAGRDFETKIVVKVNAPQLLRKELRAKRWKGDHIAMGTATDPYQRAEGKYKLMKSIIETLLDYRNPFSILTKGTLILRDLELLAEAAAHMDVATAFSIPTFDDEVWARSEPGTPHPRKRIEAVRKLNDAGIPCGVLIAPILPGLSDRPEQIREVVEAAIDAGATHVSPILLHLRPIVKDVYMEWLGENYPDLVPRYNEMYESGSYAPNGERKAVGKLVTKAVAEAGGVRPRPERPIPRWRRPERAERDRLSSEQLKLI